VIPLCKYADICGLDPRLCSICGQLSARLGREFSFKPGEITPEAITNSMLGKLTVLNLARLGCVDDRVLAVLCTHCKSLEILHLNGTNVTDAGIEHCAKLTKLELLNLSNTGVTNAGLEHLYGLSNLQNLLVMNTQVDDTGKTRFNRKRLDRGLPTCCIRL